MVRPLTDEELKFSVNCSDNFILAKLIDRVLSRFNSAHTVRPGMDV